MDIYELEDSLDYIASSRISKALQRNPFWKNQGNAIIITIVIIINFQYFSALLARYIQIVSCANC